MSQCYTSQSYQRTAEAIVCQSISYYHFSYTEVMKLAGHVSHSVYINSKGLCFVVLTQDFPGQSKHADLIYEAFSSKMKH